uniref:DDB1- and CUL4-associated factor 10 n=1 Tax=Phallusia mammillata TaxID=59560 RepID=A0A6F9D9Y3_9ASCI|nr:DDB1- and CUL4-associated factor 10-like [Phallusia mammillata]
MSVHSWIKRREIGHRSVRNVDDTFSMQRQIWRTLYRKNGEIGGNSDVGYRGIFGLKYSPDGSLLVAACENDAIVVIDPLTSKIIKKQEHVHTKRCNTITFIDNQLFSTCSDDSNISVWDIRNLREEVHHLKGHTGWVKNVEFHKPSKSLVSSSFDDQILLWDIDNPSPYGQHEPKLLLKCANLMRMRLSPDGSSMYLSSMQTADLIAIHNLNFETIRDDLRDIRCQGQYGDHSVVFNNHEIKVDRSDKLENQSKPVDRENHLELYYGYNADERGPCTVFCQSIDVHPENLSIALRYDRLTSNVMKYTSVHNTWSFYNGRQQGNNAWAPHTIHDEHHLPIPRGLATNFAKEDGSENVEYIQEICYSPCGRLIASPFGYGIRVMALDSSISDYRSHISSRVSERHQWDDASDKVLPSYVDVEPQQLHDVAYCFGHRSMVLSTCFSPTHMQVASGSKNGQIIIHETVL